MSLSVDFVLELWRVVRYVSDHRKNLLENMSMLSWCSQHISLSHCNALVQSMMVVPPKFHCRYRMIATPSRWSHHFSDSESTPQFTLVEHANYPEFPPNKSTEELEDERRQALKDLKEWDGTIMTPEMEWIQHYMELAHLEAQAQHYGNPYFQFNHLMDTISPMFTLKGEEFLQRHFDMKESNIQTIARHIYPLTSYYTLCNYNRLEQTKNTVHSTVSSTIKLTASSHPPR
ncbi:hypothetical protein IV203_018522 [Nitzschia inconspicua]|uniref:Uncharacterized protein n=1 Tax=Nitzschia inconspicua TaxID=303405 RepID=A0A9K3M1J4_9STRA|nr:hypothetical protein IV203_018522 [Nitzschia inconspicua]